MSGSAGAPPPAPVAARIRKLPLQSAVPHVIWGVNKMWKILLSLFGVLFAVLLFLAARVLIDMSVSAGGEGDSGNPRKNHYAFYLPGSDTSFFTKLKEGAIDATKAMDCAVSFHATDEEPEAFEMAPYSGVDGIAVYLFREDQQMRDDLHRISRAGIPIVQIENSLSLDDATFFIGTNGFETGKAIGRLAEKAGKVSLNMVLVYSEKNPGPMSDNNLIEMGMKSVLGERIQSLTTEVTSLNPLDAEKLTYTFLSQSPSADLIVLTDPNDTLVTVQTIISMNLVGKVKVIGFGEDDAIREYIEKGILLGSIVRNPYRIGYSAVMALKEISTSGYTSAYVDTGLNIITAAGNREN